MLSRSLLAVCFLISIMCTAQSKSEKRGVAYGNNTIADLQALSKGVTWWYNWYHQPESTVINIYQNYGFDYVPMAWNGAFDKEAMRSFLSTHPQVKYILGWNEPNFTTQANMTPSQAAAMWPELEEIADEFDLEIVGPAMNYCDQCVVEDGITYTDPVKYLDDFFAACTNCRVDHIAIHSYMGNVSALQWYVGLFAKYDRPIWLTEFANWENNPTLHDQKNFLVGAVDYLENDPAIYRYAWFTGRHTGAPYIGLLGNGQPGKLTELGEIYVNMPLHNPDIYYPIPATIEAEHYNKMSGVLLELTQDESGFANVGYIDAGDWLEYGITVPESTNYFLSVRASANYNTSFEFFIDGKLTQTIQLANTGGWQSWQTTIVPLDLPEGNHLIRLRSVSGGFNLNWLKFTKEVVLGLDGMENNTRTFFPNPTKGILSINNAVKIKEAEIIDLTGRTLFSFTDLASSSSLDISFLPQGIYFLKFQTSSGETGIQKILLN